MNCLRARQEMKAMIDGELRPWTRLLVACHITLCKNCRREMEEMTELSSEVQNTPTVPSPRGMRDKVMAGLTFQPTRPAKQMRPLHWSIAGGLAAALVVAAAVYPTLMETKVALHSARQAAVRRAVGGFAVPRASSSVLLAPKVKQAPLAAASPSSNYGTPADVPAVAPRSESAAPATQSSAPVNLMIIKTAELSVQVKDFQQANDEATSIAKSAGGYVTDTSSSNDSGNPTSGCLTLRIPVDAFERTLNRLTKLGKVTARSISGEDVTGESVDLESRLRNLRAEERQYLEIMNRAKRIPDIVTVTNELSRVRGEIEEAQGRLKYLKSASAMSTIDLTIAEKQKPKPQVHKSALRTTFGNAITSLGATLSGLASVVIWLLVYSPFWAIPLAIWYHYRRRTVAASQ